VLHARHRMLRNYWGGWYGEHARHELQNLATTVTGWDELLTGARFPVALNGDFGEFASPARAETIVGPTGVLRDARVLIVDDCTLHRENLAALIAANGAAEIGTASDLPTLTRALREGAPSVMLLNIATIGSATLLREALEMAPDLHVIVLGVAEDDEPRIVECAEAGASSYHTRGDSTQDLLTLVAKVNAGESFCSPRVSATLIRRLSALASQRPAMTGELVLTTREAEILEMLKLGLPNREIAEELCIAVHTVKNHVHSLLAKLGVNSRGEAAALAASLHSTSAAARNAAG
jgi:DNA-binding NarL/FixJ family response regulator